MGATSQGKADPSLSAEAGRLVADAIMDRIADAVLALPRGDDGTSHSAPARPAPSLDRQGRAGASAATPAADSALARLEAASAAVVSAVLSRIDVNAILDRVDVQRVLDRVDVHGVVQRVDLNEALAEIDVDALIERVDVDAIVDRVDVGAVASEALEAVDIGDVIRESTASLGSDTTEGFRQQAMIADGMIIGAVDRLLRRSGPRDTALEPPGDGS